MGFTLCLFVILCLIIGQKCDNWVSIPDIYLQFLAYQQYFSGRKDGAFVYNVTWTIHLLTFIVLVMR